jgi:hypothetical protein
MGDNLAPQGGCIGEAIAFELKGLAGCRAAKGQLS